MIAVFSTTCDCFVFTPWTGLKVKRAMSVIDNCINKTGISGTFDNAIKQFHRQRVNTTEKAEKKKKKSGTAESMLGQKKWSGACRTCGPPPTALQSRNL